MSRLFVSQDATFQEDGQLKNTGAETPTGTARLMHMNTVPIQKPKDDKSAGAATHFFPSRLL